MGGIARSPGSGSYLMKPILIFHLQAPLMSFGGPQIDQIGPTGRFPTVSQITGLLGNALGYRHNDFGRLQALQDRLSLASALVLTRKVRFWGIV